MNAVSLWIAVILQTALANGAYYNFTVNGTAKGAPCIFPFTYQGQTYTTCTKQNYSTLWCSTTNNYDRDKLWGECPNYDICQSHRTLSDPWRNIGFNSYTKNDLSLDEGWYHFSGVGGDHLVYCSNSGSTLNLTSLLVGNSSRDSQSSIGFHLYTCNAVYRGSSVMCDFDQQITQMNCGGGLTLYYLIPSNGIYATRHSFCNTSSCGVNAQCGLPFGSCVCNPGLSSHCDLVPQKNSYGCSALTTKPSCKDTFTQECATDFLGQFQNLKNQEMPQEDAIIYLNQTQNSLNILKTELQKTEQVQLETSNSIVKVTELLVSALVETTETQSSQNFTIGTLEIQIFSVGSNTSLRQIPPIRTNTAILNIDLIGLAKINNGSASVAFMSFGSMGDILEPKFFKTSNNTNKTMMSHVVSITLPNIVNKHLTKPVNFILLHTEKVQPGGVFSCVYWTENGWITDGCSVTQTTSNYTVCSCVHLSTFAIIMQTNITEESPPMELLGLVAVTVGLVFLFLTLLTFAVCGRNSHVNNTAHINLCISLLLAHLLFLLTQQFQSKIQPLETVCALLAGVIHFLFLSAFVWMFVEAVLLFISVKNMSRIRSKQKDVLDWKCLVFIGYAIPLVVVGVSAGLFPEGYGSAQCWIKTENNFIWSFLGPVCFILTANVILFSLIAISLRSVVAGLNTEHTQIKHIKTLFFKTLLHVPILGCPWALGFFTGSNTLLQIVFLILNSQQGTFIFFIHCVLNHEVRQRYRKILRGLYSSFKTNAATSEQTIKSFQSNIN